MHTPDTVYNYFNRIHAQGVDDARRGLLAQMDEHYVDEPLILLQTSGPSFGAHGSEDYLTTCVEDTLKRADAMLRIDSYVDLALLDPEDLEVIEAFVLKLNGFNEVRIYTHDEL